MQKYVYAAVCSPLVRCSGLLLLCCVGYLVHTSMRRTNGVQVGVQHTESFNRNLEIFSFKP